MQLPPLSPTLGETAPPPLLEGLWDLSPPAGSPHQKQLRETWPQVRRLLGPISCQRPQEWRKWVTFQTVMAEGNGEPMGGGAIPLAPGSLPGSKVQNCPGNSTYYSYWTHQ